MTTLQLITSVQTGPYSKSAVEIHTESTQLYLNILAVFTSNTSKCMIFFATETLNPLFSINLTFNPRRLCQSPAMSVFNRRGFLV